MTRLTVHDEEDCVGRHCPVHSPSDHHMKDWPLVYRIDRPIIYIQDGNWDGKVPGRSQSTSGRAVTVLTERTCPHGVGHPDPDCLDFLRGLLLEGSSAETEAVHGCDGCCVDPNDIHHDEGEM